MDLLKMIAELQTEKQRLDEAILALERLSTANTRRRGRPSRWAKEEPHPSGDSMREEETEEEAEPSIKDG
jgi:hypothetical protein